MSEKTTSIFPIRWAVAILAFVGFIFNYMLRVNINITIVSMVNFTGKLKLLCHIGSLQIQSFFKHLITTTQYTTTNAHLKMLMLRITRTVRLIDLFKKFLFLTNELYTGEFLWNSVVRSQVLG